MRTLSESLNFSPFKRDKSAVKIHKWGSVNHYETLTLYCANNAIDMRQFDDADIDSAVFIMENHGINDASTDYYYFWVDSKAGVA